MEEYIKSELLDCQEKLLKYRDKSDDKEFIATINNILTPVVCLLDEFVHDKQPNFEEMACHVLAETRNRMTEILPPETLKSGELPIPPDRDTEPCNMELVLESYQDPFTRCLDVETMEITDKSDLFTKTRNKDGIR